MTILLAHAISVAALAGIGYLFFYRPLAKMLGDAGRHIDERTEEVRRLASELRAADEERRQAIEQAKTAISRGFSEAVTDFDRVRAMTADLMRQEARRVVESGAREIYEARERLKESVNVGV